MTLSVGTRDPTPNDGVGKRALLGVLLRAATRQQPQKLAELDFPEAVALAIREYITQTRLQRQRCDRKISRVAAAHQPNRCRSLLRLLRCVDLGCN
jgi:hypothetical protein